MKAPFYSKEGKKKSEVVLNPEIYGARVNKRLLTLVFNAFRANLRKGTASTKTRKEVRGGGKKPWKQKGTGRARAGSSRSPLWRGGGTIFGPHPRDYFVSMPQKLRNKALISALSLKAGEKNLMVLENIQLSEPKTREWVDVLEALPLNKKRALCVVKDLSNQLKRASRNVINKVDVKQAGHVNVLHILQREKLLIEKDALPVLESRLMNLIAEKTAAKKGKKSS